MEWLTRSLSRTKSNYILLFGNFIVDISDVAIMPPDEFKSCSIHVVLDIESEKRRGGRGLAACAKVAP
jgi:hypothetical protein